MEQWWQLGDFLLHLYIVVLDRLKAEYISCVRHSMNLVRLVLLQEDQGIHILRMLEGSLNRDLRWRRPTHSTQMSLAHTIYL